MTTTGNSHSELDSANPFRWSRIVLARDALRANSVRLLRRLPAQLVHCAAAPRPLLAACKRMSPCVLVIRREFVAERGAQHLAQTLGAGREIRVLLVCSSLDPVEIRRLARFGYTGFIGDDAPAYVAAGAVDALLDGRVWLDGRTLAEIVQLLPTPKRLQLTAREQEVLELADGGLGVREMAEQLSIGTATIRSHLMNIRLKVGRPLQAAGELGSAPQPIRGSGEASGPGELGVNRC